MAAATEHLTGTITKVNQKGTALQIDARPGVWLTVSEYADVADVPMLGARVDVEIDSKRFIRLLAPVLTPVEGTRPAAAPASLPPSKDITITRLACIHAATRYLAPRTDAKAADVVKVAECFEKWVLR